MKKEDLVSIINQTYKNLEIIIVDDGSKDKTLEISNNYSNKDKRIKVIHQKNSGVSTARNNGIKESKGKYITFVDSDDFIEEDFIEYYVKLIKKYKTDIVLSRMPIKYKSNCKIEKNNKEEIELLSGEETALEMLYYKIFISAWNKLFKREVIIDNKIIFNKDISFGEGFNFSIDVFMKAKKVCITSLAKFSLKQITGSREAQKCLQQKHANKSKEINDGLKYAEWHTNCDCLNSLIGTKNYKNYKELSNEIKRNVKKESLEALKAPISKKEKAKALMFYLNPILASKVINQLRKRKFQK